VWEAWNARFVGLGVRFGGSSFGVGFWVGGWFGRVLFLLWRPSPWALCPPGGFLRVGAGARVWFACAGACGGACGVFVRGWGAVLLLLPVWVVVGMLTSGDGKCVVLGVFAFAFFQEGAWGCAC
jgi:hypothetical protein